MAPGTAAIGVEGQANEAEVLRTQLWRQRCLQRLCLLWRHLVLHGHMKSGAVLILRRQQHLEMLGKLVPDGEKGPARQPHGCSTSEGHHALHPAHRRSVPGDDSGENLSQLRLAGRRQGLEEGDMSGEVIPLWRKVLAPQRIHP